MKTGRQEWIWLTKRLEGSMPTLSVDAQTVRRTPRNSNLRHWIAMAPYRLLPLDRECVILSSKVKQSPTSDKRESSCSANWPAACCPCPCTSAVKDCANECSLSKINAVCVKGRRGTHARSVLIFWLSALSRSGLGCQGPPGGKQRRRNSVTPSDTSELLSSQLNPFNSWAYFSTQCTWVPRGRAWSSLTTISLSRLNCAGNSSSEEVIGVCC